MARVSSLYIPSDMCPTGIPREIWFSPVNYRSTNVTAHTAFEVSTVRRHRHRDTV